MRISKFEKKLVLGLKVQHRFAYLTSRTRAAKAQSVRTRVCAVVVRLYLILIGNGSNYVKVLNAMQKIILSVQSPRQGLLIRIRRRWHLCIYMCVECVCGTSAAKTSFVNFIFCCHFFFFVKSSARYNRIVYDLWYFQLSQTVCMFLCVCVDRLIANELSNVNIYIGLSFINWHSHQ